MKNAMRKTWCLAVITLACFAPWARGESTVPATGTNQAARAVLAIRVPEPSSPALLTIDLLTVGIVTFLFYRRKKSV
jgi:hypothetical protein